MAILVAHGFMVVDFLDLQLAHVAPADPEGFPVRRPSGSWTVSVLMIASCLMAMGGSAPGAIGVGHACGLTKLLQTGSRILCIQVHGCPAYGFMHW